MLEFFKKQTGEGGMKSEGHGKFLFLATPCEASLNCGGVASKDPRTPPSPAYSRLSSVLPSSVELAPHSPAS